MHDLMGLEFIFFEPNECQGLSEEAPKVGVVCSH